LSAFNIFVQQANPQKVARETEDNESPPQRQLVFFRPKRPIALFWQGRSHPGTEFRLQAAGRGKTRLPGEFSTHPAVLSPRRLKAELRTRMRRLKLAAITRRRN